MYVLAYSLLTLKLMLLTPAYTIKKAYGSVKLKAYDNYIKSNRKEAANGRPLRSVHPNCTQPETRLHQDQQDCRCGSYL